MLDLRGRISGAMGVAAAGVVNHCWQRVAIAGFGKELYGRYPMRDLDCEPLLSTAGHFDEVLREDQRRYAVF